jgi:hypothetical protein
MPIYGIKDDVNTYPFTRRALRQGKGLYGERWYDAKYAYERGGRNMQLESSFIDIRKHFFYTDNKIYYSTLTKF